MPEPTATLSPVAIERGLGQYLATQHLGAETDETKDEVATDEGTDETDELATSEDSQVEPDAEAGDDEATAEAEPEFALDLKVNGEEIRITDRAEAIKLAQLGKHFTQRNEQVIQRERQADEREAEAVRYRDQYAAFLPEIEAYLANPLGERPKREGYNDELSYLKADKQWAEGAERVQALKAERQRVEAEQQAQRTKALERWVREQDQAVLTAVPEWNDPTVMRKETQAMTEYALRVGITQQALQNPLLTHDKAFVLILRDAMRFQQATTKGAAEVKRVQTPTAAPGPKPAAGEPVNRRRKELEKRAASGKTADIAPLMGQLLSRTIELQQTTTKPRKR